MERDSDDRRNRFMDLMNIPEWTYDNRENEDDESRSDLGSGSLNVLNLVDSRDRV